MTIADYAKQIPNELVNAVRSMMIATSIVGIVLGIIALIWPGATLLVIGVLFGISLIVAGLFRIYTAFAANLLSGGWRFVLGLVGVLILAAGIIALFNPEESLVFLAIFIGIGWIFQGVADLAHAVAGSVHTPRWLLVLSGVVAIIAGIVMMAIPGLALATFLWVAAIMLIVVSVVTLVTLPKKIEDPTI
ncbi:HdeD family acid-resistance protein [Gordonia sp. DT101]|uniref:HdeD family acid-resistance protein n=1 Tax=Gordonia sp. DT101 TaxID=3416545 RepID=UPI003CF8C8B1